mmetsp:Transcript_99289/g.318534  ORF Transcript_99289/g.318534 Transcript_99289/m.318534 type:complete len:1107 (+) Transcript_99289:3-3323(+)
MATITQPPDAPQEGRGIVLTTCAAGDGNQEFYVPPLGSFTSPIKWRGNMSLCLTSPIASDFDSATDMQVRLRTCDSTNLAQSWLIGAYFNDEQLQYSISLTLTHRAYEVSNYILVNPSDAVGGFVRRRYNITYQVLWPQSVANYSQFFALAYNITQPNTPQRALFESSLVTNPNIIEVVKFKDEIIFPFSVEQRTGDGWMNVPPGNESVPRPFAGEPSAQVNAASFGIGVVIATMLLICCVGCCRLWRRRRRKRDMTKEKDVEDKVAALPNFAGGFAGGFTPGLEPDAEPSVAPETPVSPRDLVFATQQGFEFEGLEGFIDVDDEFIDVDVAGGMTAGAPVAAPSMYALGEEVHAETVSSGLDAETMSSGNLPSEMDEGMIDVDGFQEDMPPPMLRPSPHPPSSMTGSSKPTSPAGSSGRPRQSVGLGLDIPEDYGVDLDGNVEMRASPHPPSMFYEGRTAPTETRTQMSRQPGISPETGSSSRSPSPSQLVQDARRAAQQARLRVPTDDMLQDKSDIDLPAMRGTMRSQSPWAKDRKPSGGRPTTIQESVTVDMVDDSPEIRSSPAPPKMLTLGQKGKPSVPMSPMGDGAARVAANPIGSGPPSERFLPPRGNSSSSDVDGDQLMDIMPVTRATPRPAAVSFRSWSAAGGPPGSGGAGGAGAVSGSPTNSSSGMPMTPTQESTGALAEALDEFMYEGAAPTLRSSPTVPQSRPGSSIAASKHRMAALPPVPDDEPLSETASTSGYGSVEIKASPKPPSSLTSPMGSSVGGQPVGSAQLNSRLSDTSSTTGPSSSMPFGGRGPFGGAGRQRVMASAPGTLVELQDETEEGPSVRATMPSSGRQRSPFGPPSRAGGAAGHDRSRSPLDSSAPRRQSPGGISPNDMDDDMPPAPAPGSGAGNGRSLARPGPRAGSPPFGGGSGPFGGQRGLHRIASRGGRDPHVGMPEDQEDFEDDFEHDFEAPPPLRNSPQPVSGSSRLDFQPPARSGPPRMTEARFGRSPSPEPMAPPPPGEGGIEVGEEIEVVERSERSRGRSPTPREAAAPAKRPVALSEDHWMMEDRPPEAPRETSGFATGRNSEVGSAVQDRPTGSNLSSLSKMSSVIKDSL